MTSEAEKSYGLADRVFFCLSKTVSNFEVGPPGAELWPKNAHGLDPPLLPSNK